MTRGGAVAVMPREPKVPRARVPEVAAAPRRYALFQNAVRMVRPFALRWVRDWGLDAGTDEETAHRAEVVFLVGSADFFPSRPFGAGVEVYWVGPRSTDDPDDTEGILALLLHGYPCDGLRVTDERVCAGPGGRVLAGSRPVEGRVQVRGEEQER